ncbi:MAG: preprotein translocase subunit SecY [Candidatus Chlorobium antarcticum]|jgi:preprotein translocase subunit SecY|nr:preprotein translocase subunit SecY [Candidatus Chlorobium antarcticum]
MKLTESIKNINKIPELRQRILYTLLLLFVYRLGSHITIPGVDASLVAGASNSHSNDLFGLFDLFVGGAFARASIFSLGIMPYISASIIIQLLGAVTPYFQKLQKEGEEGRQKINQMTRFGTVLIASLQAWGVSVSLSSPASFGQTVVPDPGLFFSFSAVIILTASTVFVMWLGERITEQGIGNGISLIIMIGILAAFPQSLVAEFRSVSLGSKNWIIEIIILAMMVAIVAFVVVLTVGTRRVPVQHAKRVVGRKVYGGGTQYIPMKINTAGVMPIIFAQSIMFIPGTFLSFFPDNEVMQSMSSIFAYDSWWYALMFGTMILFFTYFYTAIAFNPKEVADTMRRQGGFIPGVRPGKSTADFIDNILTRITLPGAVSLALIAVLPTFLTKFANVTPGFAQFFGGTSLLIIVGVGLDTLQQVESHLLMRHYDGFMKSGKTRGRQAR